MAGDADAVSLDMPVDSEILHCVQDDMSAARSADTFPGFIFLAVNGQNP
jgi:hypothetical protein